MAAEESRTMRALIGINLGHSRIVEKIGEAEGDLSRRSPEGGAGSRALASQATAQPIDKII